MEAADAPSSHVLGTWRDEQSRDGQIGFEQYLGEWVKIATTRAGHLTGKALDFLIKHPERFAARDVVPDSEPDAPVTEQHTGFKDVVYSPKPRRLKNGKGRQTRVEQMRRIYLLCKTPGSDTAAPPVPESRECWESEVDKLVAWTHSLSLEGLDGP